MNLIPYLVAFSLVLTPVVSASPVIEIAEPQVKTFDSEVSRLALKYNQDETLARRIIKCESSNNAHATGTRAVVGQDIGYWQINSYFHEKPALKMGYDIYNWEDNLEYGFILLSNEGTRPWNASRYCWQPM